MREFAGGATRNDDSKKNDYRGFHSPLALRAFGDYMTEHRTQKDGTVRDSDNWKNGMPRKTYLSSLKRHVEDVHLIMEGHKAVNPDTGAEVTLVEALCGVTFNTQGLLHEVALGRDIQAKVEAPKPVGGLGKKQHRQVRRSDGKPVDAAAEGWHDMEGPGQPVFCREGGAVFGVDRTDNASLRDEYRIAKTKVQHKIHGRWHDVSLYDCGFDPKGFTPAQVLARVLSDFPESEVREVPA